MTDIQVRVVSPALGVFKGVLSKKQGISKIQLTPSMRKVGPSPSNDASGAQWVWMLVTRDFPSEKNLQIAKCFQAIKVEHNVAIYFLLITGTDFL